MRLIATFHCYNNSKFCDLSYMNKYKKLKSRTLLFLIINLLLQLSWLKSVQVNLMITVTFTTVFFTVHLRTHSDQ